MTELDMYPDRAVVKKAIKDLQESIEFTSRELELEEAMVWISHSFKSIKSDAKGRGHEFTVATASNPKIVELRSKLRQLRADLEDQKNNLSDLNYQHRQELIDSLIRVNLTVHKFTEASLKFSEAVDRFIESRKNK